MKRVFFILFVVVLFSFCNKQNTHKEEGENIMDNTHMAAGTNISYEDRMALAAKAHGMKIKVKGIVKGIIRTNKGDIGIELYADEVPNTVKNFIALSKTGFYNGLIFHRYVPNFVIQGGDPRGNGTGDAGYNIPFEENKKYTHVEGALGMARGPSRNSASCQFYITLAPQHSLDGGYVVFGKVVKGMDVVKSLRAADTILSIEVFLNEK